MRLDFLARAIVVAAALASPVLANPALAAPTDTEGFDPIPPAGAPVPAAGPALARPTLAAPSRPPAPPPPPGSTAELALNCTLGLQAYQARQPDVHIGQCSGFIDAVLDDLEERVASKSDRLGICITGDVSELDMISLFAAWAGRHPEAKGALDGVRASFREAYPCAK